MSELEIRVENIGGIDSLETTFGEGLSVISGANASNKTSLLKAVLFAFGSRAAPIKTDADRAVVELAFDGKTITRVAERRDGSVHVSGDAWIGDANDRLLFERFAGLLETNPLRTAVAADSDIEALLKEPMDIDELRQERRELLDRKRSLQQDLDALADVEARIEQCEQEMDEARERRSELEDDLEDLYDRQSSMELDDDLEDLLEQRTELVSKRETYADQIARLEDAIERFDEELTALRDDLEDAQSEVEQYDLQQLRSDRVEIQEDFEAVTERVETLQSVLTANREMLESRHTGILGYDAGLAEDTVACWTCGDPAPTSAFEETLTDLADLVQEGKQRRNQYEPELRSIDEEIERAEELQRRVTEIEVEIDSVETRRNERRESLEQKREQLDAVRDRIADLGEEIQEQETDQAEAQSDLSDEIERTRVEIETLEREIDRLDDRRSEFVDRLDERERKESELSELTERVQHLTDRIEDVERDLREEFNDAMDELLEMLAFESIERMWLDGTFDLVIARDVDGTYREDAPEHLAESEREMIGLVLGLAGFITYDVGELAPVLVLDSLGAFDAERVFRLVEYFGERTEFLLAAVHPEQVDDPDHLEHFFGPNVSA